MLAAKRSILIRNLAGELERLKDMAGALAVRQLATRDLGTDTLRRAIIEFAAALPVYRTYVDVAGAQEEDRAILRAAADKAKAARQVEDEEAIDFLCRVLELDFGGAGGSGLGAGVRRALPADDRPGDGQGARGHDVLPLQPPDRAERGRRRAQPFRCAVGRIPYGRWSSVCSRQPAGLSATSTHDTKRGEDARARLYVLSEMPEAWAAAVQRWAGLNASLRRDLRRRLAPEPEVEWMFYQALAGAWPPDLSCDDAGGLDQFGGAHGPVHAEGGARGQGPHELDGRKMREYEQAVESFTRAALDPARAREFLQDFLATCAPLFLAGALNSLAQTAIKLTAPGVPDIYQGTELWDLSLVDPDNRRAVDFEQRLTLQTTIQEEGIDSLLAGWRSGAVKMRLLQAGLGLRARAKDLFAKGDYLPLVVEGSAADRVLAFARVAGSQAAITIAPRVCLECLAGQTTPLVPPELWGDTAIKLPPSLLGQRWVNVTTGETHPAQRALSVREALGRFPVAILASESL